MNTLPSAVSPTAVPRAAKCGAFFETEFPERFDYELAFSDAFKRAEALEPCAREAAMLAFQYPRIFKPIARGDLLAGRVFWPKVSIAPQNAGVGYDCNIRDLSRALERGDFDATTARKARALIAFWQPRRTRQKVREAFPQWVADALPSDEWAWEAGEAFPLYRISGLQFRYGELLEYGVEGLRARVRARVPEPDGAFARGLYAALDVFQSVLARYERDARDAAARGVADAARMAADLKALAKAPPRTFRQAAQLIWLYSLLSGVWNYGRLDDELGTYLARDLAAGELDEESAVQFLQSWFRLMAAYDNRFDNRVMLGGRGRSHEKDADAFALLAMEAVRRNRLNQPQLSLRFYKGQNPALYARALVLLGEGCTFPILYNDDKAIPDVVKTHGLDAETAARDWLPFGCGETMLRGQSVATPNAIINLAETLNRTMATCAAPSFDALFAAFAERVRALMRACACAQRVQYDIVGRETPLLFTSLLYDDCVARGKPLLCGGVRLLSGTIETYGNITASDALAAVARLVYQENKYTLPEVCAALAADFRGFEAMRADLAAAPKYGNDDDAADAVAVRLHDCVCAAASACAERAGLAHYHVVLINNWANTLLGRFTGATADGRARGASLSNANNPSAGNDRAGVTAFLNSLLKLATDIHAGSVQNMKFAKSMFGRDLPKLRALLQSYWERGGVQAMITAVSREDLEAAMREPEKWGHLLVRVGGFSMRFVELERDVQLDILNRTLNA